MNVFFTFFKKRTLLVFLSCLIISGLVVKYVQMLRAKTFQQVQVVVNAKERLLNLQRINKNLIIKSERYFHTRELGELETYQNLVVQHDQIINELENLKIDGQALRFTGWDSLKSAALRRHETNSFKALVDAKPNETPHAELLENADYDDLQQQYDALIVELHSDINLALEGFIKSFESKSMALYFILVVNVMILLYLMAHQYYVFNDTLMQMRQAEKDKDISVENLSLVSELSSVLNHEVKNMVTIIAGYLHVLPRHLKLAGIHDDQSISSLVIKLKKTVDYTQKVIKTVSALSTSGSPAEFQTLHLNELIKQTMDFSNIIASKANVSLKHQDFTEEYFMVGREVGIVQILINLIKNAVEAVKDSKDPWIQLYWRVVDGKMQILVQDSGFGIPTIVQEKLFKEKYSSKARGYGTGLGLFISQRIAEEHGGRLFVENNLPHTTFVLELPLQRHLNYTSGPSSSLKLVDDKSFNGQKSA